MCVFKSAPTPPPPPPLPPAPAPPTPPPAPLPEPDPLTTDVNPAVRRAKSKKAKNESARGTGSLRIKPNKTPTINTGQSGPAGGTNI